MTLEEQVGRASWTDESSQIERWRLLSLIRAGYPVKVAELLAAAPAHHVDVHRAAELLKGGCPPELAAQILL